MFLCFLTGGVDSPPPDEADRESWKRTEEAVFLLGEVYSDVCGFRGRKFGTLSFHLKEPCKGRKSCHRFVALAGIGVRAPKGFVGEGGG